MYGGLAFLAYSLAGKVFKNRHNKLMNEQKQAIKIAHKLIYPLLFPTASINKPPELTAPKLRVGPVEEPPVRARVEEVLPEAQETGEEEIPEEATPQKRRATVR